MRALQTIIFTLILISVTGCGKYILKSEVQEHYISKAKVQENYILKSVVQEQYVPKSNTIMYSSIPPAPDWHRCLWLATSEQGIPFCLPGCPVSPYWRDEGSPCW